MDFGNTPVNDSIAIGDISQIGFNYRNNVPPKKLENFNSNSRQNSDIELKLKAGLNFISVLKEFCDKKFKKLDCIVDVSTNGGPNGGFVCRTCVENKEIGMGEGKSKTDAKIISCEDAIKTLILAGNKDFQTSMEIRNLKPPPKPMTQAVRNPPQAVYKAQEEVFS